MRTRKIAVIDYGTGNLRSVVKAFELLEAKVSLVTKPSEIEDVDAVIFPGQGNFDQCMSSLEHSGLCKSLKSWILEDRPFFGICLGLQVLFEGRAIRFCLDASYKIPHMGWNQVEWNLSADHWLQKGLEDTNQFYFVHSYRVETNDSRVHCLTTDYGGPFTSGIISSNCLATQFHPEKSQANGIQLYRNFLENIK